MSGRIIKTCLRTLDALAAGVHRRRAAVPKHLTIGRLGEEEAYFYLRRKGYVMVAQNFRSSRRRGEVDLIGWDGQVLCFIEVKTRTTHQVKPAEAAVDAAKQQELAAMAREYLRRLPKRPSYRFEVLSVYRETDASSPDITLFKNAFRVT